MEFNFNIEDKKGYSIINIEGNLMDSIQVKNINEAVEEKIGNGVNRFIICADKMNYMSSTGLGVLISILTKSRRLGGDISICCVPPKVQELLVITKLNTLFNVQKDLESSIVEITRN